MSATPTQTAAQAPAFERLLRSRWGRIFVVALVVFVVSLGMAAPRFELAESPDVDISRWELLQPELIRWSVWALVAWPIAALSRWILVRWGSWLLLLLIQLPVSGAVGYGFIQLDHALRPDPRGRVVDGPETEGVPGEEAWSRRPQGWDRRPAGGPGREREGSRPPGRGGDRFGRGGGRFDGEVNLSSPFWQFRWILATLIYWVIMIMVGGARSFLDSRDKERQAVDLELRTERLRAQLARAQLDSLTSQLNPHFLFNALHSVGGLVRAGQDQTALKTLAAIGELLRATLDHGDREEVELSREIEIAKRYLDIERIRLGERLEVEIDLADDVGSALVPALLLLPLVENAVRHGISDLPEGGRVSVRARRRGPSLEVEVSDSGNGFPAVLLDRGEALPNTERRSIGLENTRGRLLALYAQSQEFELDNVESGGARVRVTLPFHEAPLTEQPNA